MRLNKYLAENTDLSRRKADTAIENGRVKINDKIANLGDNVLQSDKVSLDGYTVSISNKKTVTILLNKPVGYVCSKDGQGSKTVYDLLPEEYKNLNIAGRLDKDSSGLVILTNSGDLLNELTHPSFNKEKVYEVEINRELSQEETNKLISGVDIGDNRPSKFKSIDKTSNNTYEIILEEGRNRQIRRSFESVGIHVLSLKRTMLGEYNLSDCIY